MAKPLLPTAYVNFKDGQLARGPLPSGHFVFIGVGDGSASMGVVTPVNSPNDVVVKSDDSIWFTDPGYGAISIYEGQRANTGSNQPYQKEAVYRIDASTGQITKVADEPFKPNGIAFSHDRVRVAVADLGQRIMAEDVRRMNVGQSATEGLAVAEHLVHRALLEAGVPRERVLGAGLGIPGPIDRRTGTVGSHAILPGWDGVRAGEGAGVEQRGEFDAVAIGIELILLVQAAAVQIAPQRKHLRRHPATEVVAQLRSHQLGQYAHLRLGAQGHEVVPAGTWVISCARMAASSASSRTRSIRPFVTNT